MRRKTWAVFRFGVPLIQLLLFMAVFAVAKFCYDDRSPCMLWIPAKDLVMKLNFPVAAILLGCDRLLSAIFPLPSKGELIAGILFLILAISLVYFSWYFVILEIEKRRAGSSALRAFPRVCQWAFSVFVLLFGAVALFAAYSEARREIWAQLPWWQVSIGTAFLILWGAFLTGTGLSGIRKLISESQARLKAK